jgi:predicted nucleic acid-binding protein
VIYLLDVNALIGLALSEHEFHDRIRTWISKLGRTSDRLASCTITELGLVRIVPQMTATMSVKDSQVVLARVKATSVLPFDFIADDLGGDRLPHWVRHPKQTPDGHLLELVKKHSAVLATCDQKIPGAFLIPI